MPKATDDLQAVRTVAEALSDFSPEEQERIIRWAREKLGLTPAPQNVQDTRAPSSFSGFSRPPELTNQPQPSTSPKDLKTFVSGKSPKSDVQFAATVAYFYRFEASPEQRRNEIDPVVLQDACRLAGRERLNKPIMTLNNAKNLGLLDSGSEAGKFVINTVGENLVAMTLPSRSDSLAKDKKSQKSKKQAKKTPKKKK